MKIIKEICKCGHYRENHNTAMEMSEGHGKCLIKKCNCGKFTWVKFEEIEVKPSKMFELRHLSRTITPENFKILEHLIFMAKETGELQFASVNSSNLMLGIAPSGKLWICEDKQTQTEQLAEEIVSFSQNNATDKSVEFALKKIKRNFSEKTGDKK